MHLHLHLPSLLFTLFISFCIAAKTSTNTSRNPMWANRVPGYENKPFDTTQPNTFPVMNIFFKTCVDARTNKPLWDKGVTYFATLEKNGGPCDAENKEATPERCREAIEKWAVPEELLGKWARGFAA